MAISKEILSHRSTLKLEALEQRCLLAVAIFSNELNRSPESPVVHDSSGQVGHLLSTWSAAESTHLSSATQDVSRPLYFSSIQQADDQRLVLAESPHPLEESDFAILRARPFDLAPSVLDPYELNLGDLFSLNLFADAHYSAVLQNRSTNVNGTTSLVLKLQEYEFAFGYVSITGNDYLVSIDVPEERAFYETRLHKSGSVILVQFAPDRPDVLESFGQPVDFSDSNVELQLRPTEVQEKADGEPPVLRSGGGSGNETTSIDVMVVYTPAAQAWSSNINNTIATAMARSNTAATNSNLGIIFHLAYSGLVNYTESGSSTDLGRLRNPTDGFMDEVHTLRNTHAADMVAILTFTNDTGGVGYLLNSRYGREDLAFSLTRVQQASSTDTFVHELGHNMGAMHSKFQNVQAGPTNWTDWPENTWSAGWRFQGDNGNYYTSVMAYSAGQYYPDGNNGTRLSIFSDPNITFQGQPVGHPQDGDNARTLRDVRNYVGQYRDADTIMYCTALGGWFGLGITNVQMGSIDQNASFNPYYDFSFLSTDIQVGETQQLVVSVSPNSTQNQIRVWIDWNDDKDFFDAGELVFISSPASVSQYVVPVAVPVGTQPGLKRMRIRLHQPNSGGNLSPCGNSTTGEVQDFKLNVIAPEASVVGSSIVHMGWTGSMGGPVDSLKFLAKESELSQVLGFDNLINTAQGINGLRFDIQDLPQSLTSADFVFQWSPTGNFSQASNSPSHWELAASPSSITTSGTGLSEVLIQWPSGTIVNRWLRVTILSNANTGLPEPEVYYIGHLLGEATGPADGVFTVSFADINAIRDAVGQEVDSSSIFDLDKSGTVAFTDISAMRQNIGAQLPTISISAGSGSFIPAFGGQAARAESTSSPFMGLPPLGNEIARRDERKMEKGLVHDLALRQLTDVVRHGVPGEKSMGFYS